MKYRGEWVCGAASADDWRTPGAGLAARTVLQIIFLAAVMAAGWS
jgi:hypothetical protein